jgi:hypothetical protein
MSTQKKGMTENAAYETQQIHSELAWRLSSRTEPIVEGD